MGIGRFREARHEVTPKITAALFFFLCATAIIGCLLKTDGPLFDFTSTSQRAAKIAAGASPLVFLWAGALVFFRPRCAYILGLVAGSIAMPWFVWSELLLDPWSSWILLIHDQDSGGFATLWKLRILSVTLIIVAAGCASVRLLPTRLCLRKTPLCRSTWPALALAFTILAGWFVHAATPYIVPVCTRGVKAEFQILHVGKSGLRIQQTAVGAFQDGQVYVWQDERRLFQYRFDSRVGRGVMPYQLLLAFAQSPELWKRHTLPVRPLLQSWDTERWYVVLNDSRLLIFTNDD